MPINLDPRLIAFTGALERGALMRLDPPSGGAGASGGSSAAASGSADVSGKVLFFQYNPETITRARTGRWEPRKKRRRGSVTTPQEVRQRGGQGSSALMAESETVQLKVVFDATEAVLAGRAGAAENGVLPQLAFLEVLSTGREQQRADAQHESVQPVRPDELLLVLGERRLFPVVLSALTITEQKFLPTLVPLRAEADLRFTVLEPDESAYRSWIASAFTRLQDARRQAADSAAAPSDVAAAIARELTGSGGTSA